MTGISKGRLRVALGTAALLAAGAMSFAASGRAADIQQSASDLVPCGTYDAKDLEARPIPDSIGGPGLLDSIAKDGFKTPTTAFSAPDPLPATWYNTVKITPDQAKQICDM